MIELSFHHHKLIKAKGLRHPIDSYTLRNGIIQLVLRHEEEDYVLKIPGGADMDCYRMMMTPTGSPGMADWKNESDRSYYLTPNPWGTMKEIYSFACWFRDIGFGPKVKNIEKVLVNPGTEYEDTVWCYEQENLRKDPNSYQWVEKLTEKVKEDTGREVLYEDTRLQKLAHDLHYEPDGLISIFHKEKALKRENDSFIHSVASPTDQQYKGVRYDLSVAYADDWRVPKFFDHDQRTINHYYTDEFREKIVNKYSDEAEAAVKS